MPSALRSSRVAGIRQSKSGVKRIHSSVAAPVNVGKKKKKQRDLPSIPIAKPKLESVLSSNSTEVERLDEKPELAMKQEGSKSEVEQNGIGGVNDLVKQLVNKNLDSVPRKHRYYRDFALEFIENGGLSGLKKFKSM